MRSRTGRDCGLWAELDETWFRTIRGRGQFWGRTRTCLRTGRERGLCADTDKLQSRSRTGRCRTRPGHFTNTALAIAWTIRRMLCGLSTGRQPGRCASAKRTASWIPAAIAGTLPGCCAYRCADICRCCVRCFPATARTLRGSCPAIARMICRILRGHGLAADWPWTGCGCGHCAGHSPASPRTLSVRCQDAGRIIPGYCPDSSPDAARMIQRTIRRTSYRMLRGHCATCHLTFM